MVKLLIFSLILIYASYVDIKKQIVPSHIHILLLIVGLFNASLLSIFGAFIAFLPLFLVAIKTNGIGGGDVKLAGMCGFVLQGINGLIGIMLGVLTALVVVPSIRLIRKKDINEKFPLVPYLSFGCIFIALILAIKT